MSTTVTEMRVEHFDVEALELYWRFLAERQAIYARRVSGVDFPWTGDPILQSEFITNVYRGQDPGTIYLVNAILSAEHVDEADIVFNVMLYRLMGSVPSTHEHLGFQVIEQFDPVAFQERLAELPDDHRIFGDAYRVASYHQEGSSNKVANVASTFAYLAGGMAETMRRIDAARSVIEVYKVFEAMKGFGEFLSHQIVVDLLYPNSEGQAVVPFGENEFAKAGPGARKGIWDLMDRAYRPANMLIVMEWLHANQAQALDQLGIAFPWRLDGVGDRVTMSLCDIQASLCEFHKYFRLWNGDRKAQVRKYDRDAPYPALTPPWSMDQDGVAVALARTEPWTFYKDAQASAEAVEDATEPSGSSSEVLDGAERETEPREPDEAALAGDGVQAVAVADGGASSVLEFSPAPGVSINITINVYPPQ